jgi:hypothetical protein
LSTTHKGCKNSRAQTFCVVTSGNHVKARKLFPIRITSADIYHRLVSKPVLEHPMSTPTDNLPESLKSIHTRPLFVMRLKVRPLQIVGPTPNALRRVGVIFGGRFDGDRLSGEVLDGGSDWQTVRPDNTTTLDVRLILKTSDDALIAMTYRGLRHGPKDIIQKIESGQPVDPTTYYFRIAPIFETASPKYDWINRVLAIGTGHRTADGPIYSVFEVL